MTAAAQPAIPDLTAEQIAACWNDGYSIAELWGHSKPVARFTSQIAEPHPLLWGILGIVEYQVDKGAGHRYLRERLARGDWVAIGRRQTGDRADSAAHLQIVPPIPNAKFGRQNSRIGDSDAIYSDVRVIHRLLLAECAA